MLDLFSGLGGASQPFADRGWETYRIDNVPTFGPDECADVVTWTPPAGRRFDLVWASPPCTEFAKWGMRCWYPDPPAPSLALVHATIRIVRELQPRWWVLENTRGAIPFISSMLGPPRYSSFPVFLWGQFPLIPFRCRPWKCKVRGKRPADRAKMPYGLGRELARSCESVLF